MDDNSKRIKGQRRFVFPNIPYEDRMACVCICIILIKKITRDTSLISGDFPDLIWRRGYDLRNIKATDNRFDGSRNVDDHGLPFGHLWKRLSQLDRFQPLEDLFRVYRLYGEKNVWRISSLGHKFYSGHGCIFQRIFSAERAIPQQAASSIGSGPLDRKADPDRLGGRMSRYYQKARP